MYLFKNIIILQMNRKNGELKYCNLKYNKYCYNVITVNKLVLPFTDK